jgi:UDP-glucose 4-epimerase
MGGNGFIGSHLVSNLVKNNHQVKIFDRFNHDSFLHTVIKNSEIEIIKGDFNNPTDINKALINVDVVYHLISSTIPKTSNQNPIFDIETNLVSTVKLLEAAVIHNVKKIIFISSGGTVYGMPSTTPIHETHETNPLCSYGIVKLAIEKYLALFSNLHNIDYQIFRVSNPYGEWQPYLKGQGVISTFIHKILTKQTLEIWGDGSITRDYLYIQDLINALISGLDYHGEHKIMNIGSSQGTSLIELIHILENVLTEKIDYNIKSSRRSDVSINILDNSIAKRELNWEIKTTLTDGIIATKKWLERII